MFNRFITLHPRTRYHCPNTFLLLSSSVPVYLPRFLRCKMEEARTRTVFFCGECPLNDECAPHIWKKAKAWGYSVKEVQDFPAYKSSHCNPDQPNPAQHNTTTPPNSTQHHPTQPNPTQSRPSLSNQVKPTQPNPTQTRPTPKPEPNASTQQSPSPGSCGPASGEFWQAHDGAGGG